MAAQADAQSVALMVAQATAQAVAAETAVAQVEHTRAIALASGGLGGRHLESRPKAEAKNVFEVSAG